MALTTTPLPCSIKLPTDLATWRGPVGLSEHAEKIWEILEPFFEDRGYALWPYGQHYHTIASEDDAVQNGYMYVSPHRTSDAALEELSGSVEDVLSYKCMVSSSIVMPSRTGATC